MEFSVIYIPGWSLHIDLYPLLYSQLNNEAVSVITPGVVLDLQVVGTINCHKHKAENLVSNSETCFSPFVRILSFNLLHIY